MTRLRFVLRRRGSIVLLTACLGSSSVASGGGRHSSDNSRFVVISDVDDTIKNTGVTIGHSHIKNLPWLLLDPIRPWQAVPGMSQLYQLLEHRLNPAFLYVSKGPEFSRARLELGLERNGFPEGRIILNATFPCAQADYKFEVISRVVKKRTHYLLIGDSGELDPENYGRLARTFPGQIDRILIRSVTADWEGRYRRAFAGVPHSKWEVFARPSDVIPIRSSLAGK